MAGVHRRYGVLGVGALTLVAFVLRLIGIHESLFADEVFTYRIVAHYGFMGILREVHDTAITPPLHYLLAYAAGQVGDPSIWIRVPSLLLGTATVPLVYLLGLRTVGAAAGLVGSALAAITPFAVFYGTEARAYATLMFLCVLATLALLIAIETKRRRWLIVYGVSTCLILYTSYAGFFVVIVQAAWALWTQRDRRREFLAVHAAVALAYLPWVPSFLFQSREHPPRSSAVESPVTLDSFVDATLAVFPGRHVVPLEVVPGRAALMVIAAALIIAACGAACRLWRSRGESAGRKPPSGVPLLALLGVATPLGIAFYSLAQAGVFAPHFGPRILSASLPSAWLLLGWLLTAPRRLPALIAVIVLLAGVGLGTARSLNKDNRRPPYRDVAAFIDGRAGKGEPVVELLWVSPSNTLGRALAPHFKRQHMLLRIDKDDRGARRYTARAARVFVVVPQVFGLTGQSGRSFLADRFSLQTHRVYPGVYRVAVFEWKREGGPPHQAGDPAARVEAQDVAEHRVLEGGPGLGPRRPPSGIESAFLSPARSNSESRLLARADRECARRLGLQSGAGPTQLIARKLDPNPPP